MKEENVEKKKNRKNRKNGMKNVYYLGATSFFADVSTEMIAPIIPIFLSLFGASGLVIGFIEGIAKASEHILSILSGYLSDKLKKRKIIITLGYFISAVMKGLFAIVTSWFGFLFLRTLERAGKAIRNPPRDALIAESIGKREARKGFAIHRILDTLGAIVGPLVTILLISLLTLDLKETLGLFRLLFVVSMLFGMISVFIVIVFVKDYRGERIEKRERNTGKTGKIENVEFKLSFDFNEKTKSFLIFSFIFYIGLPIMAIFYLRASDVGLIVSELFLSSFIFNFLYILGAAFCSKMKFRSKDILIVSSALISIILIMFSINSILIFLMSFAIFGFLFGIFEVETKNYIQEIVERDKIASLYGIHRTLTGISILLCGILMGSLWDYFREIVFIIASIISISSVIFFKFFSN